MKKAELGFSKLILIILAFILLLMLIVWIKMTSDGMTSILPKIFKIGR